MEGAPDMVCVSCDIFWQGVCNLVRRKGSKPVGMDVRSWYGSE